MLDAVFDAGVDESFRLNFFTGFLAGHGHAEEPVDGGPDLGEDSFGGGGVADDDADVGV